MRELMKAASFLAALTSCVSWRRNHAAKGKRREVFIAPRISVCVTFTQRAALS